MSPTSHAAVITWSGLAASFDSTTSWVGGVVPGPSDTALFDIDLGGADLVEFPSSPTNAQLDVTGGVIALRATGGSTRTYTIAGDTNITAGSSISVGVFANDPDLSLTVGGTLLVEGNSSLSASQASTITTQDLALATAAGAGSLGINLNSDLNVNSTNDQFIGTNGGIGTLTLRSDSTGSFVGALRLGDDTTAGSSGDLTVETGADLTAAGLVLGGGTGSGTSGSVTVTGTDSTLVQTGSSVLTIGGAAGTGTGSLVVKDAADFTTGTGAVTIGESGSLAVNSFATMTVKGNTTLPSSSALTLDGGAITVDSATFDFGPSSSFVFGSTGGSPSTFDVINGADVSYTFAWRIGETAGSSGTTLVSGVHGGVPSKLRGTGGGGGADVVVGNNGNGTLDVLDGGFVEVADDLYVGRNTGAVGTMTVQGVNSGIRSHVDVTHNNSLNSNIYVGGGQSSTAGNGTLEILDGALVETSGSVYVGHDAGAVGEITISGQDPGPPFTNALLDITANLLIGGTESVAGGTGTVNVNSDLNVGGSIKIWPGGLMDVAGTSRVTTNSIDVDGGYLKVTSFGLPGSLVVPTVNVHDGGTFDFLAGAIAVSQDESLVIDNAFLVDVVPPPQQPTLRSSLWIGVNNNTGTLTLTNGTSSNLPNTTTFKIGDGLSSGTGILNIQNGSSLATTSDIDMSGGGSQINLDATSSFTQTGPATFSVSSGNVNITGGVLSTGTGAASVRGLTVTSGGILRSNGPMALYGATVESGGQLDVNADLTLLGDLSVVFGTELDLAPSVDVTIGAAHLTLEGSASISNDHLFHVSSTSAQLTSGADLTITGGSELRVANGVVTIPQTLTIDGLSTLRMSDAGPVGGTVTTQNLTLNAGSILDMQDGLIEVTGGTLSVADPDLVVAGSTFYPILRLGSGATSAISNDVVLGGVGGTKGSIEVLTGSTLTSLNGVLGPLPVAYGTTLISGTNSSWDIGNDLLVGGNETGTAAGSGTLTVTGASSSVTIADFLYTGRLGQGTVNTSGNLTFGDGVVGTGDGANGTINVTGGLVRGETDFLNYGTLAVGKAGGVGEVIATGGAIQLDGSLIIGIGGGSGGTVPSEGTVTLDGFSVALIARRIVVGEGDGTGSGVGTLEVLNSDATVDLDMVVGSDGGIGTVQVEDRFGTLTVTTELAIGTNGGNGDMNILEGSQVTSPVGKVAIGPGSVGNVSLFNSDSLGAKSTWSGNALYIAGDESAAGGTGTVVVSSNSELAFTQTLKVWSGGTLSITGGSNGGSVIAPKIDLDSNQGTLSWSSGDITLTDSELFVGTGMTTDYFLGDNATVPFIGTLTISGGVIVGDPTTGPGTLTIDDTLITGATETTLVGSNGVLNLATGTLETALLELRSGGMLSGSGTVDGKVLAVLGSTINVTGDLTMGSATAIDGFIADAQLNIGAHQVTLLSKGFVNLGQLTTIAGGTLSGNRIALDVGDNIVGFGSVNAASFFASGGSLIEATGNLNLGSGAETDGFFSDGTLLVNEHSVVLYDANDAVVGSLTTLGNAGTPGMLSANNSITLEFGKNITGFGTVNTPDTPVKPLINNGNITGDTALQPITLTGYIKGVGTLDNVVIAGTDAPGFSAATVYRGSVTYAGELEIEIGGLAAGNFDIINHSGTATLGGVLDLSLIDGFAPALGDTYQFLTAANRNGQFDSIVGHSLGDGLIFDVIYGAIDVTLQVVLAGDFDMDGDVDGDDFLKWQRGDSPTSMSTSDLTNWKMNFGTPTSTMSAPSTTVPEPKTSITLIGLMILCLGNRMPFRR